MAGIGQMDQCFLECLAGHAAHLQHCHPHIAGTLSGVGGSLFQTACGHQHRPCQNAAKSPRNAGDYETGKRVFVLCYTALSAHNQTLQNTEIRPGISQTILP